MTTKIYLIYSRKACSIESAAKNNPNLQVFVLYPARLGYNKDHSSPIMKSLFQYSNIQFRHIDMMDYVKDTPIEHLYKHKKIYNSHFMHQHVSNFLPFLTLFKYGGIALDSNLIVQQPLDEISPNFVFSLNDSHLVQHEVMSMKTGHPIALKALRYYITIFFFNTNSL